MSEWIAIIPALMQAGVAVAEALASIARGEDPTPRIEAARAAIGSIPVRTGAQGAWTADTASRLRGTAPGPHASAGQLDAAAALGVRQTEPPPSPFDGDPEPA